MKQCHKTVVRPQTSLHIHHVYAGVHLRSTSAALHALIAYTHQKALSMLASSHWTGSDQVWLFALNTERSANPDFAAEVCNSFSSFTTAGAVTGSVGTWIHTCVAVTTTPALTSIAKKCCACQTNIRTASVAARKTEEHDKSSSNGACSLCLADLTPCRALARCCQA